MPTPPAPRLTHEQNRRSWNAATVAHNSHKRDQAEYLRAGGSSLFAEELELLGDLRGRSLLHLQCNSGQDSLSLVQLGAQVTGVDISDAAIDFARELSLDSGLAASFERADVLGWLPEAAKAGRLFDLVYASYGVLGWIEDIAAWMRGAAGVLEPGGRLVLLEFHPLIWSVSEDLRLKDPYFTREPFVEPVSDYVAASGAELAPSGYLPGVTDFVNPERACAWQWTTAQILQALIDAGLQLTEVREYPFANGLRFLPNARALEGNRFTLPHGVASLPLQLGLVAVRPA